MKKENKNKTFECRLTKKEKETVKTLAKQAGMSISAYVRSLVLEK